MQVQHPLGAGIITRPRQVARQIEDRNLIGRMTDDVFAHGPRRGAGIAGPHQRARLCVKGLLGRALCPRHGRCRHEGADDQREMFHFRHLRFPVIHRSEPNRSRVKVSANIIA